MQYNRTITHEYPPPRHQASSVLSPHPDLKRLLVWAIMSNAQTGRSVVTRLSCIMVAIDPFSSQLNLYHCPAAAGGDNTNGGTGSESRKTKIKANHDRGSSSNKHSPRIINLRSVWRILKSLNSNRRICLDWLWSQKNKSSPKDKGYGKLVTDEEKRFIV